MSAIRHWIALDEAVSRLLPGHVTLHARERFARRAAALTDIYMTRLLKTIARPTADDTTLLRHLRELQLTHHALTDALACGWTNEQPARRDRNNQDCNRRKVEVD